MVDQSYEMLGYEEIKRLFPNASRSTIERNKAGGVAKDAEHQPDPSHEPVAKDERKVAHQGRRLVRLTRFGRRVLDSDNCWAKHFVDALVESGALIDDSPKHCVVEVCQVEIASWRQERTEIVISDLPNSEIRQAGPETHDKQKQRNPALPASNG